MAYLGFIMFDSSSVVAAAAIEALSGPAIRLSFQQLHLQLSNKRVQGDLKTKTGTSPRGAAISNVIVC